jgi:hypothetical protein
MWITDNSGNILQRLAPDTRGGDLPRQLIPYAGAASTLVDAIEARAIAVAAGKGITLVASDLTLETVQGA